MCTAISYRTDCHYFGRTLDYETTFGETVTITPRHYPFRFRCLTPMMDHYAIIGMAKVEDGYPLYYDAVNEKGLGIAGLNFPGNAVYHSYTESTHNIAPFELIPYLLGQCASITDVRKCLKNINLVDIPFNQQLPLTPLHWFLADRREALTVESTADGLFIYDNPVGVLTNNPPFPLQMFTLNHYMALSNESPENRFGGNLSLEAYSRGMGALGLPGDLSSNSRFIRAVFTKLNSVTGNSESESIQQFFHILNTVAQPRGSVKSENSYVITHYTSCCNTDRGIYYYTTYDNCRITAVRMCQENLEFPTLISYPLITSPQIFMQN